MTGAAAALGWTCLSQEWTGYHSRYLFECARGHRFERSVAQILYLHVPGGCPQCSKEDLRERWHAAIKQRGGMAISGEFKNQQARHRLKCAEGHEWETRAGRIFEGSWCPKCARISMARGALLQDGMQRLGDAAQRLGGRCLTSEYTGVHDRYLFECAEGHSWEAVGNDILRGSWCRTCRLRAAGMDPDGLVRLRTAAQVHGGVCLSTAYMGQVQKYRFRCAEGHEWQAQAANIHQGGWCPRCAVLGRRLSIEQVRETARERGGLCLSQSYITKEHKLTWQCRLGHVWQARAGSVRQGRWCPSCAVLDTIGKKNNWKRQKYLAVGKTRNKRHQAHFGDANRNRRQKRCKRSITHALPSMAGVSGKGVHLNRWTPMTEKISELRVVRLARDGRRRYEESAKRALIERALRPGVSVARLAQEHGINANLLRKWITKYLMQREVAGG